MRTIIITIKEQEGAMSIGLDPRQPGDKPTRLENQYWDYLSEYIHEAMDKRAQAKGTGETLPEAERRSKLGFDIWRAGQ